MNLACATGHVVGGHALFRVSLAQALEPALGDAQELGRFSVDHDPAIHWGDRIAFSLQG